MRRATVTLPDDLDRKVERFRLTQPVRPSLTSLVQAALDNYLESGVVGPDSRDVLARLLRHRADIRSIVHDHGGSNPRLFGSMARGESDADSDVDILVDLEPGRTLFDLAAMRAELERLLEAPVDVMTSSGLGGDVADEILLEAIDL